MMNGIEDYDVDDNELPRFENNAERVAGFDNKKKGKKEKDDDSTKSTRKPRPKLDFNRLLRGSRGLGYLAVTTRKHLKLSGRPGSEMRDLSQICVYLQEWAKLVFPKMNLGDFLMKSEEICQSRLMKACVPQLLSKLKEIGEDVNLSDVATVENEIFAQLATDEVEKVKKSIESIDSASGNLNNLDSTTKFDDFDLSELIKSKKSRSKGIERSEMIGSSSEADENEEEDEEYSKEMADFINDLSESEPVSQTESVDDKRILSESESEPEPKTKTTSKSRGISINFGSSEDEGEAEVDATEQSIKKRTAHVLMSEEEE